jgi:hypothetical protein
LSALPTFIADWHYQSRAGAYLPVRVVVVLDDAGFAVRTAETLRASGIDALVLPSSLTALDALEASATSAKLELLVTCPQFAVGPPHGVALALMARQKRPGVRVLFIGPADLAPHSEGLAGFMAVPVTVGGVVNASTRMPRTEG